MCGQQTMAVMQPEPSGLHACAACQQSTLLQPLAAFGQEGQCPKSGRRLGSRFLICLELKFFHEKMV